MKKVKYFSTLRTTKGGFTTGNYTNFNLATHTGDDTNLVIKNRKLLVNKYNLPQMPKWLEQTHSNICLDDSDNSNFADSIITRKSGVVCCVMTADCLPIFAYDKNHTVVGVAHAGWQGILGGVIQNFIQKFNIKTTDLIVDFGVALGQENFEVGIDFYHNFIAQDNDFKQCFIKFENKYKFNIYQSATIILKKLGITTINNNNDCTFSNQDLFSYRRDGNNSGRQAHLIWLE